jgi:hypothetical protein
MANARASVNELLDWLRHLVEDEGEHAVSSEDKTTAALVSRAVSAAYGPLSAIAYALIEQAAPAPTVAPTSGITPDRAAEAAWHAANADGCHTLRCDHIADAVREALT